MPATEVVDLKRQAVRLAESVREAGALALSMFKTPLKNWTKGEALSPVSDADIAVDVLLRERLAGDGATIAWLSEESIDDPDPPRAKTRRIVGGLLRQPAESIARAAKPFTQ